MAEMNRCPHLEWQKTETDSVEWLDAQISESVNKITFY